MASQASQASHTEEAIEGRATPTESEDGPAAEPAPALPLLSSAEFRQYNSLAETMEAYHNHFRQTWTMLYKACTERKLPAGMTIRQFLDEGLQFVRGLTMHHGIEERYVFPQLAERMIEFQPVGQAKGKGARQPSEKTSATAALLVRQHREIHVGMDGFEAYLRRCRSGETDLDLSVLREQMDSWGKVLWQHLDDEVATLGAENMRKHWSLAEMRRLRL